MTERMDNALMAQLGDEDAEDPMTLLLAAEARRDATFPAAVSTAMLKCDSLLKSLRQWRGLTQAEAAELAGINQGYLSELESRAKAGSAETLAKLAAALDVPVAWLA